MKKKVAIIGSGIAGLTLANLLKTNSNFEFFNNILDSFNNAGLIVEVNISCINMTSRDI